jgi:hypothetical protein
MHSLKGAYTTTQMINPYTVFGLRAEWKIELKET